MIVHTEPLFMFVKVKLLKPTLLKHMLSFVQLLCESLVVFRHELQNMSSQLGLDFLQTSHMKKTAGEFLSLISSPQEKYLECEGWCLGWAQGAGHNIYILLYHMFLFMTHINTGAHP